ncbi:MAG: LysM peptidoglycan-binding domain-containing protein [Oscillochloris sp.]|nr:LysM peptidoglycan-binding domain-containing protein [Oscillochloris sp.]
MSFENLTIYVETGPNTFDKKIVARFNPSQITIVKTANWQIAPAPERDVSPSHFTYGEPATLTMDLFFDTYDTPDEKTKQDVRAYTKEVFALTTVQEHGNLHRPPICQLSWGKFTMSDFQWVLQSLTQRFTLFHSDGTPVRATLTCSFRQWRAADIDARLRDTQSADVAKRYIVRLGDTLSSIAAQEYSDPALWRPIAQANRIDNPRILTPGQTLVIPALRPGAERR